MSAPNSDIQAIIHQSPFGVIAVGCVGGVLRELDYERADRPAHLGRVYLGRVRKVQKSAGGAFVDLGLAEDGYLPLKRAPAGLHEGMALAVAVDREAETGKGPRLTPAPEVDAAPEARPPCLLRSPPPLARRCLASWASAAKSAEPSCGPAVAAIDLITDKRELARDCADLARAAEFYPGSDFIFDDLGLDDAIEGLLGARVALASGASLMIETTEALTAVDVNSAGAGNAAPLAINLEAAAALAGQLRLRHLGGLVAVDFLKLTRARDRDALLRELRRRVDPLTQVGGFTALGLVDLNRRRSGRALGEGFRRLWLSGRALAALRRQARHRPAAGLALKCAPALAKDFEAALSAGGDFRAEFASLTIIAESDLGPLEFEVAGT